MLLISLLVTTANGLTNVTDNYDHEIMIQTQALRAFARRRLATYGRRRLASARRRLTWYNPTTWSAPDWGSNEPSFDSTNWDSSMWSFEWMNKEEALKDPDVQQAMEDDGIDMTNEKDQEEWYENEYAQYFNEEAENQHHDGVPAWEPYYVWCIVMAIVIMVWLAPRLYKGFKIEGCMGLVVFAMGAGAITSGAMCLGFANEAGFVETKFFNPGGMFGTAEMFPDDYYTVMRVDMGWDEGKPDFWGSDGSSSFASRAGMCAHVAIALAIMCALTGTLTHFVCKDKDPNSYGR